MENQVDIIAKSKKGNKKKTSTSINGQLTINDASVKKLSASIAALEKATAANTAVVTGSGAYAYGRGKYKLGRGLGGALGGAIGASLGMPGVGKAAGGMLGAYAERRVRGRGAYVANDLVNGMAPNGGIPTFGIPDENGTVRIRHKEYIGDIYSPLTPGNFVNQSFNLNPGLAGVFPWLSQTASNYDEYEFRGLIFTYNPVISDSSNSGAMGTVMLATVYNASSAPFDSKQQMLEYSGSVSARICDTMVHGVECDPRKHGGSAIEYVRAGAVPSGQDIKTYDLGIFQIATSGVSGTSFPAGTQLGELWVSYDVELRKPKFWDNLGYSILTDSFYGITGCTTAIPLGTAPFKSGNNSIGGTLTKAASNVYTFPDNFAAYVRVEFHFVCVTSGSATIGNINIAGQIATGQANFETNTGSTSYFSIASNGTAAGSTTIVVGYYRVSPSTVAGGNTITFTAATMVGGVTVAQIIISEVNPLIGNPVGTGTNYIAV